MKVLLSMIVAGAISQYKWLWFYSKKPQKLEDFQKFDGASQGPYGAVQLLFTLRGR